MPENGRDYLKVKITPIVAHSIQFILDHLAETDLETLENVEVTSPYQDKGNLSESAPQNTTAAVIYTRCRLNYRTERTVRVILYNHCHNQQSVNGHL